MATQTQAPTTIHNVERGEALSVVAVVWGLNPKAVERLTSFPAAEHRGQYGFRDGARRILVNGRTSAFLIANLDETDEGFTGRWLEGERDLRLRLPVLLESRQVACNAFLTLHPVLTGIDKTHEYVVWSIPTRDGASAIVSTKDRSYLVAFAHDDWLTAVARFVGGERDHNGK